MLREVTPVRALPLGMRVVSWAGRILAPSILVASSPHLTLANPTDSFTVRMTIKGNEATLASASFVDVGSKTPHDVAKEFVTQCLQGSAPHPGDGPCIQIPNISPTLIQWTASEGVPSATTYEVIFTGEGTSRSPTLKACGPPIYGEHSLLIVPSDLPCRGQLLIPVIFEQSRAFALVVENRQAPHPGTDLGIGLSLIDRHNDDTGFRAAQEPGVYVSLSKLRTDRIRAVVHVAFLDQDPEINVEVGLSGGLILKTASRSTGSPQGFAAVIGVGRNLMLHHSEEPWYTLLGLSYNFDGEQSSKLKLLNKAVGAQ